MTRDPFCLPSGYVLDGAPSEHQAAILKRLREGDRIVVKRGGRGYEWERGGKIDVRSVEPLVNKCWLAKPCRDGPLFGEAADGSLTVRGQFALCRYEEGYS